jgi:hypothetical protein
MSNISQEDITNLENWLDDLYWANCRGVDNSNSCSPSWYKCEQEKIDEDRMKMLNLLGRLTKQLGFEE